MLDYFLTWKSGGCCRIGHAVSQHAPLSTSTRSSVVGPKFCLSLAVLPLVVPTCQIAANLGISRPTLERSSRLVTERISFGIHNHSMFTNYIIFIFYNIDGIWSRNTMTVLFWSFSETGQHTNILHTTTALNSLTILQCMLVFNEKVTCTLYRVIPCSQLHN